MLPSAVKGLRHSGISTPASIPWAIGTGIEVSSRCSTGMSPVSMISTPLIMNAPTDSAKLKLPAARLASSAAPGVDQATVIGSRCFRDSTREATPTRKVSASRPEDACEGLAPACSSPVMTTAKDDVNPTMVVMNPASTASRGRRGRLMMLLSMLSFYRFASRVGNCGDPPTRMWDRQEGATCPET